MSKKLFYYGSTSSAPVWVDDYSVQFDGVNEYSRRAVSGYRSVDTVGTLSGWIKIEGGTTGVIWCSADEADNDIYIFLSFSTQGGNKRLTFSQREGSGVALDQVYGNTNLSLNTWYHVAVTSDGLLWRLYVNGVLQTLTTSFGVNQGHWLNTTGNRDNIVLGALVRLAGAGILFQGKIDEFRYYSVQASGAQITAIYNAGCPDDPTLSAISGSQISDWPCGDNDTYPTLTDSIGGFNLTMTNQEAGDIQGDVPCP